MPVKELNKSEEVRNLHAGGLKSASEIMAKLKARGISVAPAQVYSILATKKGKKKSKKNKQADPPAEKETVVDYAVVFVKAAGGMQKAREMLAKLSSLQN